MTKVLEQPRSDNLRLAIFAILAVDLALSLGDALVKLSSGSFPLWQIFLLRSLIAVPVLVAVNRGRNSLWPQKLGWTALRSMMLVLMWIAYYVALPHVALAAAAAVLYTAPLFITLAAGVFNRERVDARIWVAIALGFIGILFILKPQAGDFNAYALLPLISALLYTGAVLLTRSKCKEENPLVLSLGLNVTFIVVGAALGLLQFPVGPWVAMDGGKWLAMAIMSAAVVIGSVGMSIAYQSGPSSVVSTFDFSYLAFAAMWGVIFFMEWPDTLSLIGILLIAAAGYLAVSPRE